MPRPRPKTIVANSLEELEILNRLHANASGIPGDAPDEIVDPDELYPPESPDEDEPDPLPEDGGDPSEGDDVETAPDAAPANPRAVSALRTLKIVRSWVYPGSLSGYPSFVDPSWAAYLPYDEATRAPPSPALRVPTPSGDKYARPGDYVVLQTADRSITTTVDVWVKSDFERLFPKPPAHKSAA